MLLNTRRKRRDTRRENRYSFWRRDWTGKRFCTCLSHLVSCICHPPARKPVFVFVLLLAWGGANAAERRNGPVDAALCVSCHAEFQPALVQAWRSSGHGAAQASCVSCHGTVHDGGVRARQQSACIGCHGGAKAPAVHSYSTSKHGVIVTIEGRDWDWTQSLRAANYRAPNCAYCHFHAGEHDTRRLIGNAGDVGAAERARDAARAVCYDCHAPRYVGRLEDAGARMLDIARMKQREADALVEDARVAYPDDELAEALRLLARMQGHVTNVRLGVGHQSPDYQWWHGHPALDGDLLRIKGELSRLGRATDQSTPAPEMDQPPFRSRPSN